MDLSTRQTRGRRGRRPVGCPGCGDFDWDKLQANPFDGFHSDPEKIVLAASEGCATCHILLKGLEHCYPYVFDSPKEYRLGFHGFDGPMRWDLFHPGEDIRAVDRTNRFIEIFSYRGESCPWDLVGPADHFTYDLESAIQQAQIWLGQCRNEHAKCAVQHQATLPTRVVRIALPNDPNALLGSDHPPKVKVHETGDNEIGNYITLSHCWGKNPIITTQITNIDQYKSEIPWSELSKTFQDAIIFASLMRIENIWIDSLCIIQNSSEDWSAQAVKMAEYYTNSEFTIAATASTDGAGGLYHSTPPDEMAIEVVGVDPKTQSSFRVGARKPLAHLHDVLEDRARILERFPLLSRGWVYQERILSRRFLHFGPREIHWECHEEVECQCGGSKAALDMNPSGTQTANQALAITKSNLGVDEIVLMWMKQIESLTSLAFTHVSDQLPALSGIATLMRQSQVSGRYLAGLWEEGLLFWLCWATQTSTGKPKTLSDTPSWSWASVQGHISYDFIYSYFTVGPWGERGHRYMLLVDAAQVSLKECIPSNPSLSGKLNTGLLSVSGRVAQGTLHSRQDTNSGEQVLGFSLRDNDGNKSGNGAQEQICYPFEWDTSGDATSLVDFDGQDVLVVHLLSYERLEAPYDGPTWMRAFLLVQAVDEKNERYKRIGILCNDITGRFLPSRPWRDLAEKHHKPQIEIEDRFRQDFKAVCASRDLELV
ncbi:hypothetical protein FDECE_3728 [Fusarium decemcellulare]|nr:hypothetical protein FDECE_3728 [Fusarium decemcellulare]